MLWTSLKPIKAFKKKIHVEGKNIFPLRKYEKAVHDDICIGFLIFKGFKCWVLRGDSTEEVRSLDLHTRVDAKPSFGNISIGGDACS